MAESQQAVRRWRRGHAAAEARQRELLASRGPEPQQAVAEALSALHALEAMGAWPGPRDAASEADIVIVRRRWAKIQRRAREAALARSRGRS